MIKYGMKWIVVGVILLSLPAVSQEKPQEWSLKSCIDYARQQNIQIRKSRVALEESIENTKEVRAQRLPSLSFSSTHNYMNRPNPGSGDKHSYTGSYDLNSSVTLFQGGKLKKNLQQMDLQSQVQELAIEESEDNIELAITQAFLQLLYVNETVKINENIVEVSESQCIRGKELMDAGLLSPVDFAQLESQYTSDKYQLVVAQSSFANAHLELKQLLELGLNDSMQLVIPALSEEDVLVMLPAKEAVFLTSLSVRPEVKYNQLNVKIAGVEKEKAWAGYLPSLRLSAGLGTSHVSGNSWSSQVKHNWGENVGLTLSIPIFSNRSTKTAVNLARLNIENAELNYESVQKSLLKSVENVYQEAISAQERYRAAQENLKAVELSFRLTQEQFFLGMKNTLEMLTEKNNLQSARLESIQAKYMAILNIQLLNFYQGKEMTVE